MLYFEDLLMANERYFAQMYLTNKKVLVLSRRAWRRLFCLGWVNGSVFSIARLFCEYFGLELIYFCLYTRGFGCFDNCADAFTASHFFLASI